MAEEFTEEDDQPNAPSANGKSAPFEGEDVGSIPTGASTLRYKFEPVEGKPFTYYAIDKETGEKLNITQKLQEAMNRGQLK